MGSLGAGSLNRRILIQRRKAGTGNFNQPLNEWEDYARVHANIKVVSGMSFAGAEFVNAGSEVSRVAVSMRIRFRTDINASMRVVHLGQVYEIRAVLPDLENREYVDLGCAIGASVS
jgi:SPP1 family predicted phage head-tail adaptor